MRGGITQISHADAIAQKVVVTENILKSGSVNCQSAGCHTVQIVSLFGKSKHKLPQDFRVFEIQQQQHDGKNQKRHENQQKINPAGAATLPPFYHQFGEKINYHKNDTGS